MATKNKPGEDSIYIVTADEKAVTDELKTASKVSLVEKEVIERKTKYSKYVWWGDTVSKTKDGNIFTEIGRDMVEAQKFYLSQYPDKCYDRTTIRKILPTEETITVGEGIEIR